MMNYRKGRNVEEELTRNDIPIENLPEDFLWMHVSVYLYANAGSINSDNRNLFVCNTSGI